MATPFKWNAAPTSFALFTGLTALSNGQLSGESASFSGNTELTDYGWIEIDTAEWTVQPSDTSPILVVYRRSNPGSGQEDAPVQSGAQQGHLIATRIPVRKATGTQRLKSPPFLLYPMAQTFYLENRTGQGLSAGSNLTLWHSSYGYHGP